MLKSCKNCGGYFTADEIRRIKPPVHQWDLTAAGTRALAANVGQGIQLHCPRCGQNTLWDAARAVQTR